MHWLIEQGICEDRAIALSGGEIMAARSRRHDRHQIGARLPARLYERRVGSSRGLALTECGAIVQLDRLSAKMPEGATIHVEITREAIFERSRTKRMVGKVSDDARPAPDLSASLTKDGHTTELVRRFPVEGWADIFQEAFAAQSEFAGGTLDWAPTAAMTLIDIDGTLPPRELALAAIPAIALGIQRFEIAGSIGIDFPTLPSKADRRAVDTALSEALAGWPHESTAMNGFGFVQLVARLERPSLLHRAQFRPAATAALTLVRQAENISAPGTLLITGNPALAEEFDAPKLAMLGARLGRTAEWHADPSLAIEAGYVQARP